MSENSPEHLDSWVVTLRSCPSVSVLGLEDLRAAAMRVHVSHCADIHVEVEDQAAGAEGTRQFGSGAV